jgi:hypothetical protein
LGGDEDEFGKRGALHDVGGMIAVWRRYFDEALISKQEEDSIMSIPWEFAFYPVLYRSQ